MDDDFALTPDTQAVLLLCSAFGRKNGAFAPLTLPQYNVFAKALNGLGKRPADLLDLDEQLIGGVCAQESSSPQVQMPEKERILGLLRRGMTLSTAVDKWSSYGVRVVSRADGHYPKRMRDYLMGKAPALLYYAGNAQLFEGDGMAFVGSRDLSAEAGEAIRKVVRGCVDLGMSIVSGGARGADQTAMREAFACGGKVVGALTCDLLKACLEPSNRDALSNGGALLFSAFDPELRPFNYGAAAMERNKYIYAMADGCFVAQSGIGSKSGTWSGAVEELKRPSHHPVYVFLGNPASEGCVELLKKGALKWDMDKPVAENMASSSARKTEQLIEQDLFNGFSAAEPVAAYGVAEKTPAASPAKASGPATVEGMAPYDLFLVQVKEILASARKETEVSNRLKKKLDLVSAQVKYWLGRAEKDGVVARKEYPSGKKKPTVMLELVK